MSEGDNRQIVVPKDVHAPTSAVEFLVSHMSVLPTHKDVFGGSVTIADLQAIVSKYAATEWLSYLSRIQLIVAAHRVVDRDAQIRVFAGALGPRLREALTQYSRKLAAQGATINLFYERQLTTLQQFVVLNAPNQANTTLETPEGRDDLGLALLITADLMTDRPGGDTDVIRNLECRIQDQIRMSLLPAATYVGRAFDFYELANTTPSPDVEEYLSLFAQATEVNTRDFVFGGLAIAVHEEINLMCEQYTGWCPIPRPEKYRSPVTAAHIQAYLGLRSRSVAFLREEIHRLEGTRSIPDWNLIALSMYPVVDFSTQGSFVMNLTAVGRSLFDGVRHAILTAALSHRLPEPWNDAGAVGSLYGRLFERFVQGLLEKAFPGRVNKIPTANQERADFIIPCAKCVMVVEVKGEHFRGLDHPAFATLDERMKEIEAVGLPKALRQIAGTIGALRRGEIQVPDLPEDWTTTHVVPVVVTDERLPQVPGCWDKFYATLMEPLDELKGAGPIAPFRLISLDDLESVIDLRVDDDLGSLCLKWAHEPKLKDVPFPWYLHACGIKWDCPAIKDRFLKTMYVLAGNLGMNVEDLRAAMERRRGKPGQQE